MATPIEAMDAILSPMISRYSPPGGMDDPDVTILEYAQDLEGFTRPELEKGWAALRQSHDRTTWPHFSEILTAVRSEIPKSEIKIDTTDRFGDQREYWWNHAESAPAYPEAVAAGVPLTFRNMCAKIKRWPQSRDVATCQGIWSRHLQLVDELARSDRTWPLINKLGASMVQRNTELIQPPFPPGDDQ